MKHTTTKLETGHYGRVPYVNVGSGSRSVVVLSGGNAFVRRFSATSIARDARRISRLFPADVRLCILYYDPLDRDVDSIVRTLSAILAEHFGPATVAGVSFGGLLALRLAMAHPELVSAVILVSSAARFSAEGRDRVERQIEDALRGDLVAMARPFTRLFRRWWWNWLARAGLWLGRRALRERMNDPAIIASMLRMALAAGIDDASGLRRVQARTLIVGGTRDQFFDRDALEETARAIVGSQLRLAEGETHMLPLERPDIVARAITAFLGEP